MSFYPVYSKEKENVIIKEKSAPLPEDNGAESVYDCLEKAGILAYSIAGSLLVWRISWKLQGVRLFLYASHLPLAPQGSTRPLCVTGSPISSALT